MTALTLVDGRVWATPPRWDALAPYGCYTTFVVAADGTVRDLDGHLARLHRDATRLGAAAADLTPLRDRVADHVTRCTGPLRMRVTVLLDFPPLAPERFTGLRVVTSSRPHTATPPAPLQVRSTAYRRPLPEVKSTDLFTQLRLLREARLAGYDDAVFTDGDELLEGTTWNLIGWTGTEVITPHRDVLPGITADALLRVSADLGFTPVRRPLRRAELPDLRLLAACNAVRPVRPVARLDEQPLPLDRELLERVLRGYEGQPGTVLRSEPDTSEGGNG